MVIRELVHPCDLLYPPMKSGDINRPTKASFDAIGLEDPHRYSAKAFHLRWPSGVKNSGGTLSVIMGTARWSGPAFRSYLSILQDEEACVKALIRSIDQGAIPPIVIGIQRDWFGNRLK